MNKIAIAQKGGGVKTEKLSIFSCLLLPSFIKQCVRVSALFVEYIKTFNHRMSLA